MKSSTKRHISQLQSHNLKYLNQQLPVGILEGTPDGTPVGTPVGLVGALVGTPDGIPIK